MYEYFVYDGKIHTSPLSFDRDINHTIALFSFSKAFGMSGFRIGYMIFPSYLFDDILKVQDTIGICAPSISQIAASTAIGIGEGYVSRFMPVLKENRRIVHNNLSSLQGVDIYPSSGAYYFFISYQNEISSWELSKKLIQDYKVMVLPGSIFDAECFLRISYGNLKKDQLQSGIKRLVQGLKSIV